MKINFRTFTSILLFGTLISIIVGVAFYGMKIFDIKSPLFQFISYGFIGSFAFALLKAQCYYISLVVLAGLFIGLYYLTGAHFLVSHIFYYISMLLSIFIFSVLIFDHLKTAKFIRPLILATMISIFFVSNTFLLSLIYSRDISSTIAFKNMFLGLLIGVGIGIGIEMGYFLVRKEVEETNS
ncbi:MAG: hypothetical protein U9O95_04130 [Candidatus Marinimicrobia bacterium]|nr:hypothetical protein [Candidatus Neomarinimicrobiota bacterium]